MGPLLSDCDLLGVVGGSPQVVVCMGVPVGDCDSIVPGGGIGADPHLCGLGASPQRFVCMGSQLRDDEFVHAAGRSAQLLFGMGAPATDDGYVVSGSRVCVGPQFGVG